MLSQSGKSKLGRSLGATSAILVVVGTIVGSAVFLVPSEISRHVPFPKIALCVWVLAGLISILGALNFAELAAAFPGSGGPYVYFNEAFGPVPAYVYGWAIALIIQPGALAAEAAGLAKFAPYIVPVTQIQLRIFETIVLSSLTMINLLNVNTGKSVLSLSTALKVLILLSLGLLACFSSLPVQPLGVASILPTTFSVSAFGVALIAAFWTFDGWANLSYVAGEVKEPGKNLPKAFCVGVFIALGLFLLINAGLYRSLPVAQIIKATFPIGEMASVYGGRAGLIAILVCVGLCTLTCMNSSILSGGRMAHTMSDRGDLPAWLGYVHPKNKVPSFALLLQLGITLILLWSGSYESLFTYVMSASFAFYALTAIALLKLRRDRKDMKRPFLIPLYPWSTLAYLAFTLVFLTNTVWTRPYESLIGFAIILLGIPVYYLNGYLKKDKQTPPIQLSY